LVGVILNTRVRGFLVRNVNFLMINMFEKYLDQIEQEHGEKIEPEELGFFEEFAVMLSHRYGTVFEVPIDSELASDEKHYERR